MSINRNIHKIFTNIDEHEKRLKIILIKNL
jgi:hypothetical protein